MPDALKWAKREAGRPTRHPWATMKTLLIPALMLAALEASATETTRPAARWEPDQVFIQVGIAEDARTTTIGVGWSWAWQRPWAGGTVGGYWEGSLGRWASDTEDGRKSTNWV